MSGTPVFTRIEAVFNEVVGLSPADRAARLASLTEGDEPLRRAVSALLDAGERVGGFLEEPILGRAFDQLSAESRRDEQRDDLLGSTLGHFRLEKRIASGGMGTVYLASRTDEQFKQRVAIKVVKRGMDSDEILRRFTEERQTLASLDHPSIARLLDAGATPDGRPYLVMEYVEGQPIDRFADQHRLSIRQRLTLFQQVCLAVHAAHQSLVIHRDLKPGNILVTPVGLPKLLDFGIAKVLTGPQATVTIESERRLTPEYASPEQVQGGPITTASDVYSLGIILYELLSGTRPYAFTQRSTDEVRRIVCAQTPPPPSQAITRRAGAKRAITAATTQPPVTEPSPEHNADYPRTHRVSSTRLRGQLRGDLDNIVMMALRKEPQRRYPSAQALADDIALSLAGMPVKARRDTWLYRTRKFVTRNAPAVLGAAAAVALLVAALIVQTHQRHVITGQRNELAVANTRLEETRRLLVGMLSGAQTSARGPAATLGEVLRDAAATLDVSPPADAVTLASLREAVGTSMMTIGLADQARPLLEGAFEHFKTLPSNSPARLAIETELAQLLYYQGRHAEAEVPLRDLLARERARNAGTPTPLEGDLLNALGAVLRQTSRFDEALTTQTQALAVRAAVHGANSLPVAESHNNIGSIHLSTGRAKEAAEELTKSMQARRALLRHNHPLLLATAANLGLARSRSGDHQGAIVMLQQAADGWAAAYGPADPGQATVLTSLGLAQSANRQHTDAASTLSRALAWQTTHLDPASPALLATRVNLAVAASPVEPCATTVSTLRSLRADEQFLKLPEPLRRKALTTLADALTACGENAEAERIRLELAPAR